MPVTHVAKELYTQESFISLYPNPATEVVNINYCINASTPLLLQVTDIAGKQLFKTELRANCNTYALPINQWVNGYYQVSIVSESGKIVSAKLLINK